MSIHDPLCVSQEFLPADLTRFCDCERVARVRADERKKVIAEYATWGPTVQMIPRADADALAARAARAARDAARAEARVAKSEIRILAAFLAEARAEVAALQVLAQDANEAFAAGRREVLADLRAKADECSTVGNVLALIEEAGQ